MELEVGMYVRTKDGTITKISGVDEFALKCGEAYYGTELSEGYTDLDGDDIAKASHNIIDLIEIGDYVNGKLVTDIEIHCCDGIDEEYGSKCLFFKNEVYGMYAEDIKTILTKEQFERCCYKVGNE